MMTEKRKAISYIHYSTLAQGTEGRNSTQRQKDALTAALAKWNLELDATFKDEGKSGYHQRHLAKGGAMHRLREMAVKGELKGMVVVVEDWDRTGRMQTTDAAPLILDMLNNGVDMVVGAYGGEHFSKDTVNANPFLLYRALDEMNRGFSESKRKTGMAKAKFKARIEALSRGESVPLNAVPFWIANEKNHEGKCTGKFFVKDGMKKLIKEIFAMYLGGEGSQVISRKLNARGVPLPLRRDGKVRKNANVWHSTMIHHLIKNRALIGYYHGTEYKAFEPIIDEATFYRANQTLKSRIRFSGRKAEHVNPYAGLCVCHHCTGTFTRHSSRKHQQTVDKYVYLQCRSSKQGKCSAAGMQIQRFEDSFSGFLSYVDFSKANSDSILPSKTDEINVQIAKVERQIAKLKTAIEAMEDTKQVVSLATMLTKYDVQHAGLTKELEAETIREKGTRQLTKSHYDYLVSLYGKENKLHDPKTRLEIQEALREAVDRITIDVKTQSYTVTWKHMPHVFKVQLLKDGYKVSGEGCINLEFTYGDGCDVRKAA